MYQVNIAQAKAQLSDLVARVANGEDVVICKHNKPIVKLVPFPEAPKRRILGQNLLGNLTLPDDFFEPMSDEELAEWERPIDL